MAEASLLEMFEMFLDRLCQSPIIKCKNLFSTEGWAKLSQDVLLNPGQLSVNEASKMVTLDHKHLILNNIKI